jgi:hypothetical protein
MTIERQDIRSDWYAGNTKDLQFTIVDEDNDAYDLTGCEINFALYDDDYEVAFRKSSSNGSGEIEVTDADDGICLVHCIPTDTEHLQGQYRHQLQIVDSSGYVEIVSTGTVLILPAMAKRNRKVKYTAYLEGI